MDWQHLFIGLVFVLWGVTGQADACDNACRDALKTLLVDEFKTLLEPLSIDIKQIKADVDVIKKKQEQAENDIKTVKSVQSDVMKLSRSSAATAATTAATATLSMTALLEQPTQDIKHIMDNIEHIKKKQEQTEKDIKTVKSVQSDAINLSRCPDGLFVEDQCFIPLKNQMTNWTTARELCQERGLHLAQPHDTIVAKMRTLLLHTYGDGGFWLNGRGTEDGLFLWLHSNRTMEEDDQLWSPSEPGEPGDHTCLTMMMMEEEHLTTSPDQPYHQLQDCGEPAYYPLCQRLLQSEISILSPILAVDEKLRTHITSIDSRLNILEVGREDFMVSGQRYLLFRSRNLRRTWSEAQDLCKAANGILAEPSDNTAIILRKYMVDTFGDVGYVWLGAQVSGGSWQWSSSGATLPIDSSLWWTRPAVNSGRCLLLRVYKASLDSKPQQPYGYNPCTSTWATLCQVN